MNKRFSIRNRNRCESPSGFNYRLDSWSTSDWITALVGELGEAANIVKKLNRVRDDIPGNKETKDDLLELLKLELADTYIYLDLLCQSLDIDLEREVEHAFKLKSIEIGYLE
jgi:NTP pyrophosphatase (non-canonical NTP hydrolase)